MIFFGKKNDVLVHLVAHPKKMQKDETKKYPVPSMYDISGSSDFYNKTDYGISVDRMKDEEGKMINFGGIHILKVKFKHLGRQGKWDFAYNINNGRLQTNNAGIINWENRNWITKEENKESKSKDIFEDNQFDYKGEVPF
jgi:twinkle protein